VTTTFTFSDQNTHNRLPQILFDIQAQKVELLSSKRTAFSENGNKCHGSLPQ